MKAARSLAANTTTLATSSATPMRPSGLVDARLATSSPAFNSGSISMRTPGVSITVGAIPNTRMPSGPNSRASALVAPTTACFDAT